MSPLLLVAVVVLCSTGVASDSTQELDPCLNGIRKCAQEYMNVIYSATTADQLCQYINTHKKCILLACPELNGTLDIPPEQQKQMDEAMQRIGVDCDAPVGSQGEFHGFTAAPGSSPQCMEKTENCSRWYVNASLHVASVDDVCGNVHTFASCAEDACGVPISFKQSEIQKLEKLFEDNGIQCDISNLFQRSALNGDNPSNDSGHLVGNTTVLSLALLWIFLRGEFE